MEKMSWVRPALDLVQFEANDYVASTCLARWSGKLFCGLPGNPGMADQYGYDNCYDPDNYRGDTHRNDGTCCDVYNDGRALHGTCALWTSEFEFVGNQMTQTAVEQNTGAQVWGIQVGNKIENFDQNTYVYQPGFASGIGTVIDNLSSIGYYLASWFSGTPGNNWRQHFGVANITGVELEGNPNKS